MAVRVTISIDEGHETKLREILDPEGDSGADLDELLTEMLVGMVADHEHEQKRSELRRQLREEERNTRSTRLTELRDGIRVERREQRT